MKKITDVHIKWTGSQYQWELAYCIDTPKAIVAIKYITASGFCDSFMDVLNMLWKEYKS